jgi:hypothetical protein
MKKTLRKLSLSRETVRTLEFIAQGQVVGGAKTDFCTSHTCPEICDPVHLLTELC